MVVLFPFTETTQFSQITQGQWVAISYACLNTVGAYAAFAQALKYWQASRVGMVIAMVPVFTLMFINLMSHLLPQLVAAEKINAIGFIGVILIVTGSVVASMGKKQTI
jgi:drug/metabolite transporter (DMT)-like permease